jgi:drug/metabolite transporter (DMT)-like permease
MSSSELDSPAMTALPHPQERPPQPLRLLEDEALEPGSKPRDALQPWVVLFGALCLSAGHGIFLACALTQLEKLPSRREIGIGWLQLAVVGWFVAAGPLALLSVLLRERMQALGARAVRALALAVVCLTLAAFSVYLRAIVLG